MSTQAFISREGFLNHWQGHRNLTRRVIEKFPQEELFKFSIGGMRTFSELLKEILTIGVPGLEGIVNKTTEPFDHNIPLNSKEDILKLWDKQTEQINTLYSQIKDDEFEQMYNLFGQYEDKINHSLFYFVDNEIHHRAQGYVYLRALGIEPPFFWER